MLRVKPAKSDVHCVTQWKWNSKTDQGHCGDKPVCLSVFPSSLLVSPRPLSPSLTQSWCESIFEKNVKICLFDLCLHACFFSLLVLTSQVLMSCTPQWTPTATWKTPQVSTFFLKCLSMVAFTSYAKTKNSFSNREQPERDAFFLKCHCLSFCSPHQGYW